tara:strand:- start:239 stop:661 length:423 start_codon:yes stop_codon:yes gene_type:complete
MPSTKGLEAMATVSKAALKAEKSRSDLQKKKRKERSKKEAKKKKKEITKSFGRYMETAKDLREAGKKLTVHQDPRSKQAARIRHMLDQPKKKLPISPHRVNKPSEGILKTMIPSFKKGVQNLNKGGSVKLAKKYFKGGMV